MLSALDPLCIATGLDLGDDLSGRVSYGDRLGEAAIPQGIAVVAPR